MNRIRVPWWGWTLIVLGLLGGSAVTALAIVRHGWMREMRTLAATLQADGRGITPGDLVARAPAVDPHRQATAWAIMDRAGKQTYVNTTTWGLAGRYPRPADAARVETDSETRLQSTDTLRADWRKLRTEGPVVLGLYGWVAEDLPNPAASGTVKTMQCRLANLHAMRVLTQAFATEARRAEHPGPALAELDAMVESMEPVGAIIDGAIRISLCEIRDEAWLEAALRGADPRPWVDSMPDPIADAGASIRTERLQLGGGFYQDVLRGSGPMPWSSSVRSWLTNWMCWYAGPHDLCTFQQAMLLGEDLCRTGHGDLAKLQADMASERWKHPISSIAMPNLQEYVATAVQRETSARRLRLAAWLGHAWLTTRELPVDANALPPECARLATATFAGPAIHYVRTGPSSFRLWSDPTTPGTDLLPAGRITAPSRRPDPGSGKGWLLELDLASPGQP